MDRLEKKMILQKKLEDKTKELKETADDFKSIGRDVLLIGGILLLAYALFLIMSEDEEESDKTPSLTKGILGNSIKGVLISTFLAIAKEKLQEYLNDKNEELE